MVKNPSANAGDTRGVGSMLALLEEEMATHPSILAKDPGQRSLLGYSLWGHKDSDMTEHVWAHTRTHAH